MSTTPLKLSLAATALLVTTLHHSTSNACSNLLCWPPTTLPQEMVVVPANLPAFRIFVEPRLAMGEVDAGVSDAGAPLTDVVFTLVRTGSTPVSVPLAMANVMGASRDVSIMEPLVVGANYELTVQSPCLASTTMSRTTFTAGPAAPAPTTLGQLVLDPARVRAVPVPTNNGGCYADAIAYGADVHVELSNDARPWSEALVYTTLVDGMPWAPQFSANGSFNQRRPAPGGSYLGRGRDEVHTLCGAGTQVLAPGMHTVQMTAQRPGDPMILRTNEVTVDLRCPENLDAGYNPNAMPAPQPMHGGGCSVSQRSNQRSPGGVAMGLIAVALVAANRRKNSGQSK